MSADADAMARLAAHGERFLSMFDDAPSGAPSTSSPAATAVQSEPSKQNRRHSSAVAGSGSLLANMQGSGAAATASNQKQTGKAARRHSLGSTSGAQPSTQSSQKGGIVSGAEIDEIEMMIKRRRLALAAANPLSSSRTVAVPVTPSSASQVPVFEHGQRRNSGTVKLTGGGFPTPEARAPQRAAPSSVDARRERKLFMSSKPGNVHADVCSTASVARRRGKKPSSTSKLFEKCGVDASTDTAITAVEFAALQTEVDKFGATGMDKRAKKAWDASFLNKLGSKGDRTPRTPASIGKGKAVAQAGRDAVALEAAMAAGMVQRKGHGKKRRAEANAKAYEPGLLEAGRGFRNGVLRLKSDPMGPDF